MNLINDQVFATLHNEESLWMREYKIELFNRLNIIGLIVYTYEDDGSDITDNQRKTYIHFEDNKENVLKDVEQTLIKYCREDIGIVETDRIESLITLKYIKIMHTENGEDRRIGFIFDTLFDSELGVGILVSNEKVIEVGVQDIVL
ncbi:DUF6985 domain-containing protein [Acinetobacter modestus]|uniref:DUF6985 domain-containing protein n=1 Tax=Acinetobacter modestus TaxID=1776740 RepID=A0ABP2TU05_9GAMM|nr:hypothetical protein [Acinetobacter modestus]ENU25588.1 hypothetical protein F992_03332 [Acinetobacter modestus]GGA24620.1 DUF2004 domain-containing protein [Acinetobacter modestus]